MSWRDDINRRLRELGNIIEIPPDKLDSVRKVLENTWSDATSITEEDEYNLATQALIDFDPSWE